MTPAPTCTRCGQALTAPVYDDAGAAYGSTCARRLGLVREPVARVRARGEVRVPRAGGDDARQVAIAWEASCATFAADYQAALDAQGNVWGWLTESVANADGENTNGPGV